MHKNDMRKGTVKYVKVLFFLFLSNVVTGQVGLIENKREKSGQLKEGRTARRPNILFLLSDDQRWNTLGCLGNNVVKTPELDQLAAGGILFTNSFVTTSVCSPSRAIIVTGKYARSRGVTDLAKMVTPANLSETTPYILRDNGYYTGHIGKWDVGPGEEGFSMGTDLFDFWAGDRYHGNYWHERSCPFVTNDGVQHKREIKCTCPPEKVLVRTGHAGMKDPIHTDAEIVPMKLKQFLAARDKDKPFYLSVSFRATKDPWSDYPPEFDSLYKTDQVLIPPTANLKSAMLMPACIRKSMGSDHALQVIKDEGRLVAETKKHYRLASSIDASVGKLRRILREANLDDNTIIIFASDNGMMIGDHGLWGKWLPYDPSIRVPLIIFDPRLPGELRGRKVAEMVLNVDYAPTILSFAGIKSPSAMHGMSLVPLITKKAIAWRKDWYYEHTWTADGRIEPSEAVRTAEWKYIRYYDQKPVIEQLFNLRLDPDETKDMISDPACSTILKQLRERLEYYRGYVSQ